MDLSYSTLKADYTSELAEMHRKLRGSQENPDVAARGLLAHKDRFLAVERSTGVPALWLIPVWYREDPRFDRYFGNGDPLDRKTTDVPRGRGPFATWEEGCEDSLTLDRVVAAFKAFDGTWEFLCYHWESWNGFGPRERGRPSGYLWSGTDRYAGGKFTSDGHWSRGTWDEQLGCVILAKSIVGIEPALDIRGTTAAGNGVVKHEPIPTA
jgi:lysozyme family protein